jgi:hypothetical protein
MMRSAPAAAPATQPSPQQMFFEAKVRPLLVDNCLTCHGDKKQKGGLRLDSMFAILKGGKHGAAVVPGKPQTSRMITAVSYQDTNLQMPPEEQLTDDQVHVLTEWVKMGAPWPASDRYIHRQIGGKHRVIADSDRSFWSFQPVKDEPPPVVHNGGWCRNPVDRFISAKLEAEGLQPAPEADRNELIRRATFDLTGLPPTPQEVQAFVEDLSPDAYEHLIDRLLASPRYGERWARHWLDLVRYAESDGFNQDLYRANAWPYRDYVIRAFNDDKPYDQFVTEQLAGDEVAPQDPNVIVATGYLRAGLYEFNQRDVPKHWDQTLIDITDVTADTFLGLSMQCCRCHDHKFDPILQTDYFRFRAFFSPVLPKNDFALASTSEKKAYAEAMEKWEQKTAGIRAKIAEIEAKPLEKAKENSRSKFPPDMQDILHKPREQRTPYEQQLAALAGRQIDDPSANGFKLGKADKAKCDELKKELEEFDNLKPAPLTYGLLMSDVGPVASPTYVPGDTMHAQEPGFPVVFDKLPLIKPAITPTATTTGRRRALAQWMVQPGNPLTSRVMVNRIWQHHFGRGIVSTSGDFGHLGTHPTHPELLDYLATRFVQGGWHIKPIHKLIMTSAAYRQSALRTMPEVARLKDPDNRWLWRMCTRRLDAEQIHDAMLDISGELQLQLGGPSVDHASPSRAIYAKQIRNKPDPLLEVFDVPESFGSVPVRNTTTTATQALLMINGNWTQKRAAALAERVRKEVKGSEPAALVDAVYRLAYGRAAESAEREEAVEFLSRDGNLDTNFVDFCHVILNSSEFLYVD